MIELGYFSLCLAFVLSVYAFIMGIFSLWHTKLALLSAARNALIAVCLCVFLSSVIFWNALFFHDFSVRYVYLHSSIDTPPLYLFASFWSALEGSHLLWTLLMSLIIVISLVTVRKKNQDIFPGLCIAYGLSLSFMLFLSLGLSDSFERLFPVGQGSGQGMNALLQNPYMAIHPPVLFAGYSLLVVPFAYSLAALIHKKITPEWVITVRRWSLISWSILSVALFLGAKWAYLELGWGGYWSWDPVENSSFLPWLAITAGLHTLIILDRIKRLPRLAVFLNIFAFTLSFQGTFMTRSGIISSVHSFTESNIGPVYFAWVLFLLMLNFFFVFTRGNALAGAAQSNEWGFSKESALLFTNFFLLFLLALVFVGTVLPLVIEATQGIKISIQQPFYNAFAPWIGFCLVLLLGIGNLMRWHTGKIEDPIISILFPFIWSIPVVSIIFYKKDLDFKTAIIYEIIFWTAAVLIMDLIFKLRKLHWNGRTFLKFNRPYLGSLLIHLAFLMAIIGFSGSSRNISAEVNLKQNQSTIFQSYKITNDGLSYRREYNVQYVIARLHVENLIDGEQFTINPIRSKFNNSDQWFNKVGVHSTIWHDLYTVLASFNMSNESLSLKMNYNPTIEIIWISVIVAVIGVIIAISGGFRKKETKQSNDAELEDFKSDNIFILNALEKIKKNSSSLLGILIAIIIILITLFSFSSSVFAQQNKSNQEVVSQQDLLAQGSGNGSQLNGKVATDGSVTPMIMNPIITDIAKELRCPTCLGMNIIESGTPQSIAMRADIEHMLAEGKTKQQIINSFKQRYGAWILREPDTKSNLGFLIWMIIILALIIGPFILFLYIKFSKLRHQKRQKKLRLEIEHFIVKKKSEIFK